MANLYSKKSEAKRGFKVFSSMSLILNILNLVIGPFYSPAFSMFYMAIIYLPGKFFDSLMKSFNMHMSDNVAFF